MDWLSKVHTVYLFLWAPKAQELKSFIGMNDWYFRSMDTEGGVGLGWSKGQRGALTWCCFERSFEWKKGGAVNYQRACDGNRRVRLCIKPAIKCVWSERALFAIRKLTCLYQRFKGIDSIRGDLQTFDWSGSSRCKCWRFHCCQLDAECTLKAAVLLVPEML